MDPWFFRDPERFRSERAAFDELARNCDWLQGHRWRLGSDGLEVDVVIRAHEHEYPLRLIYPDLFPAVPPTVRPVNPTNRLTWHQYGDVDGPLCLEWGPDNWHAQVTGAEMLASAYRLLEHENPAGRTPEAPALFAPSRHQLTVGQELRGTWCRWYLSPDLRSFLENHPGGFAGFSFSLRRMEKGEWVALVHSAKSQDGGEWTSREIPSELGGVSESDHHSGIWLDAPEVQTDVRVFNRVTELQQALAQDRQNLLCTDGSSPVEGLDSKMYGVLIRDSWGGLTLFLAFADGGMYNCALVTSETEGFQRSPYDEALAPKSVGIVGLGSLGSKIAVSLVRMGIRNFHLIDHDVLLPENLSRHALDWSAVARHKVDAVATALRSVSPQVVVSVSHLHLTGQESSASVNGQLTKLSKCDLIVDATADSRTFNLLAATAEAGGSAMVWAEVYGGGLGGLVARSRPAVDLRPQEMRGAYLSFCVEHPAPLHLQHNVSYGLEPSSGPPLIAADADVGVIADHAASLVIDSLRGLPSRYPYSLYLIGLAKGWVFEQPFSTIPIDTPMGSHKPALLDQEAEVELQRENLEFLKRVVTSEP